MRRLFFNLIIVFVTSPFRDCPAIHFYHCTYKTLSERRQNFDDLQSTITLLFPLPSIRQSKKTSNWANFYAKPKT